MLTKKLVALFMVFFMSLPVFAADSTPIPRGAMEIDVVTGRAIASGLISGGIVLVGNRDGVLLEFPFGKVSRVPDALPVTVDTVFDLASLTKVVATTSAIMKLAESGRLSLVDPVGKWFPELAGKGKDELLIVNLLTHTSGLDDFPLSPANPLQSALDGVAAQKLKGETGHRFHYADINFILLSELVRRVAGTTLDRFVAEFIFAPLGMKDTGFNPDARTAEHCAATLDAANNLLFGKVQDYSARLLDGVAGHAGLFSTARDLSLFCRMLLNEGELNGRRVFQARTVKQMTVPYFSRGGKVARGLGWDMASPYSSPRGNGFSEYSFGHTGYSGSSVWVDPQSGTYVIFLSSRLDYRNTSAFSHLRSDISSLAAIMFASEHREHDLLGDLEAEPAR